MTGDDPAARPGARYDFTDSIALETQLDHWVRKNKADLNGL